MREFRKGARRLAGRWKRRVKHQIVKVRRRQNVRLNVQDVGWDQIRVNSVRGRRRILRLDDPGDRLQCHGAFVRLHVSHLAILLRIVLSGVLSGNLHEVRVQVDQIADWQLPSVRPPRPARDQSEFTWRRNGQRLELTLAWTHPRDVHRALADVLSTTMRHRLWDSSGGDIYATDRESWLAGASLWPQSQITGRAPTPKTDDDGRRMGPYLPVPDDLDARVASSFTSLLANPYGRLLVDAAHHYRLESRTDRLVISDNRGELVKVDRTRSPEGIVDFAGLNKYAVVEFDAAVDATDDHTAHLLRVLAASGAVLAMPRNDGLRRRSHDLGLVTVDQPESVTGLYGYALSVGAARQAAIRHDPALRRTSLGGGTALATPNVTIVMSSMRADDVPSCLAYLAAQTYPSVEIVIGTHGYSIDDETRQTWEKSVPFPLRVLAIPGERTLGMALAQLSSIADGDLIAKVDDDDHYGPNHVTDLVLAWHQSGADLVAKGARFVHLPDLGKTIDRQWAAREQFNGTPAGGTLLLSRSALQQVGGWSTSPRRVDADLIARIRSRGGVTYRTHALGYVYVRRTAGHTWPAEIDELLKQGKQSHDGLPDLMITGDAVDLPGIDADEVTG